jgi:NADH dehydrogenase FAD-containing subunit
MLSFIVITSLVYYLLTTLIYRARTKHIEVHYHFIKLKNLAREINLIHVNTENQVVDIFTKTLSIDKLKRFRKMLGVLEVDLSMRGNVENSILIRFH